MGGVELLPVTYPDIRWAVRPGYFPGYFLA